MQRPKNLPPYLTLLGHVIKWLFLASLVALLAGTASAAFLFGLEWATDTRNANRWLIWLLPVAGFVVGWVYLRWGESVVAGNNQLLDEIHDTRKVIPLRMAPLVLWGTITSHLFGASVGREGTAVQMGGSLADQLTGLFRLGAEDRRIILMAGISAGFASVFGTPIGAAVFALEVLATGRLRYEAILPCLVAAVLADKVALWWGVQHDHYLMPQIPEISLWALTAMVLAGIIFGLTARLFAEATHGITAFMRRKVSYSPLRPFIGGVVIAAAVFALGTDRYIGLGIPVIQEAFAQSVSPWDFAGKLAFTVVSLGTGFKGGEVTPLFYIGATLGNALAPVFNLPFGMLAAIGFVAVFAGAANTPLASTLMAMELFGGEIGIFAGVACVVSYLFSGHTGIYSSQRLGHGKLGKIPEGLKIGEVADWRKQQKKDDSEG